MRAAIEVSVSPARTVYVSVVGRADGDGEREGAALGVVRAGRGIVGRLGIAVAALGGSSVTHPANMTVATARNSAQCGRSINFSGGSSDDIIAADGGAVSQIPDLISVYTVWVWTVRCMADVRPFRGIRYNAVRFGTDLSALICPPYDIISPSEQAALLERSPYNMVRLEGPSEDAGPPQGETADRYARAAERFERWLADEVLVPEAGPALYAYSHSFSHNGATSVRRGFLGALRLSPWEKGEVRPHEHTHAGPKADRLALLRASRANFSPIWCLYRDRDGATDRLWQALDGIAPTVQAVDDDGVSHRLWSVREPNLLRSIHDALTRGPVYIADGHHRYETALHFRDQAAAVAPAESDSAGWSFALTYFVEASDPGLIVFGTHRLLSAAAIQSVSRERLLDHLGRRFDVVDAGGGPKGILAELERVPGRPAFGVYSPPLGVSAIAVLKGQPEVPADVAGGHSSAWRKLDLAALHALAIDQLFPMGSAALFAGGLLTYSREVSDVERVGAPDGAALAFLVRATPVEQVMAVADAEDRMPEKSTYFYPKPASGLVIARCDDRIDWPLPG